MEERRARSSRQRRLARLVKIVYSKVYLTFSSTLIPEMRARDDKNSRASWAVLVIIET